MSSHKSTTNNKVVNKPGVKKSVATNSSAKSKAPTLAATSTTAKVTTCISCRKRFNSWNDYHKLCQQCHGIYKDCSKQSLAKCLGLNGRPPCSNLATIRKAETITDVDGHPIDWSKMVNKSGTYYLSNFHRIFAKCSTCYGIIRSKRSIKPIAAVTNGEHDDEKKTKDEWSDKDPIVSDINYDDDVDHYTDYNEYDANHDIDNYIDDDNDDDSDDDSNGLHGLTLVPLKKCRHGFKLASTDDTNYEYCQHCFNLSIVSKISDASAKDDDLVSDSLIIDELDHEEMSSWC